MKGKIINNIRTCLYCGEEIKGRFEEYTEYLECECSDAKKERKLNDQIRDLAAKMPKEKYCIEQSLVLYKIDE